MRSGHLNWAGGGPYLAQGDYHENQRHHIQGRYINVSQDLSKAATEIQQLLNQLSQTNPTNTKREKMVVVAEAVDQIESNPTLKAKVINALKAGGVEAFKEAIDHPLVNILMATIEGWREVEAE